MIWFTAKTTRIQEIREGKGLTQQNMAELLNASTNRSYKRAHYGFIELAQRRVDQYIALAIAKILDTTVDEIFSGDEATTEVEPVDGWEGEDASQDTE